MTGELPELLTTTEVAHIFRVARNTVVSWAGRGLLEHTRTPSGQLRFYRRSVEYVLHDGHCGAVPPDTER
ncbi:MAG: DNA-binding protein [Actinomycetia bacterium]|nr:DNA-binding protein [Actinomycetes bacterium]